MCFRNISKVGVYHISYISYSIVIHKKRKKTLAFLKFKEALQKKPNHMILMRFIFVELEINMWITIVNAVPLVDY